MNRTGPSRRFGPAVRRALARHESLLLLVVATEFLAFHALGPRFGSADNLCDILRHSCEIGLLALVMTPIILTGGIDLSVGSLLGLCAIGFGKLWRDAGLPIPLAVVGALALGAAGGGLNALLITRLRLPPLIVTLGTFSLFRGLAEAITRGVDTFTNFPRRFCSGVRSVGWGFRPNCRCLPSSRSGFGCWRMPPGSDARCAQLAFRPRGRFTPASRWADAWRWFT